MKSQRKVWLSPELKEQVTAYWRARLGYSSEADLVRTVLTEIEGGVDESKLADRDSRGDASLRIWIDDADWAAAQAQAEASGLSLHSVIRRRLIHKIEEGS